MLQCINAVYYPLPPKNDGYDIRVLKLEIERQCNVNKSNQKKFLENINSSKELRQLKADERSF